MRSTLKKFLLMLAGSGMSAREIGLVVEALSHFPPGLLEDSIQYLRHHAQGPLDQSVDSILTGTHQPLRLRGSYRLGGNVPMRVEILLRDEAGLKANQAASELLNSLKREQPHLAETLKPPNKESFEKWLHRLLQVVEPSQLLHHATLVRNRYVNDPGQDWPLRDE